MTEPVEDWIRRAGQRCVELGWVELGNALIADAKQEAGHHLLMIADVKALIDRWNGQHYKQLTVQEFLSHPYPSSVMAYHQLHEAVIAGSAPFGQIAIEFEIERLAVQYGVRLIEVSQNILGDDFSQTLSFIQTHATLDIDHAAESEIELQEFLTQYPDCTELLATVGTAALDSYREFLDHCFACAQAHYAAFAIEKSPLLSS